MGFTFYLGSHVLSHIDKAHVPLFISYRQLRKRKKKPFDQKGSVCVDSGGFSELSLYGEWTISPEEYVQDLERLQGLGLEITWAAQQDMMCEPIMLEKTGLTVREHQERTVENLQTLRSFDSSIHFIPVLQGQTLEEYFAHFEMFEVAGFDLRSEPIVGVGSVCRRQSSNEIAHIMKCLHAKGLKLHGFGVKIDGLKKYGEYLKSSDSLAWSYGARFNPPCKSCASRNVKNCANCLDYALEWRQKVIG